jgi:excisionase family DNA binding protein
VSNTARTTTSVPALLPLEDALAPYPGVSIRTARALVASGRLPAVRIGKGYHVRPADLADLFRPVARPLAGRRLTPAERSDDALREAGFGARLVGVDTPNARTRRFNMLLSDEEEHQLRWLAQREGLSASDYLRTLIRRAYSAKDAVEERKRNVPTTSRDA